MSTATTVSPPFWRYAAKALAALAVGVVAAGGTILAAVNDDRVTTSEWVAIVIAVLGAIVGPTAVYATRNATSEPVKVDVITRPPSTISTATDALRPARHPSTIRQRAAEPWTPPDDDEGKR